LKSLGNRVVAEAGNIQVGQALAQAAIFDLAVLDINIAGYSIRPVAEIIDGRGLPFFFVTGYGPAADQKRSEHARRFRSRFLISKLGEAINSILSI